MPLTRFKLSAIEDGGIATADLADGAVTTAKLADSAVTSVKTSNLFTNTEIAGTEAARMPVGTTAQRANEQSGDIRFNSTLSLMEYYDGTGWKSIDSAPVVSSISPDNIADTDNDVDITITGSFFASGATVKAIGSDASEISAGTVTFNSSTELVANFDGTSFSDALEDYDIQVTNISGLSGTLADSLAVNASPAWTVASGSLGTIYDAGRTGISITTGATDDEGATLTYALDSGSLPSGLSLNTSTGAITGDATAVGSDTTSTFTLSVTDGTNTATRNYSITVKSPTITSYTSTGSGTFSVPSGVSALDVLVVAGGGSGGTEHAGGGGAGGLIYRPAFPVTPGGSVSYTVGAGGPETTQNRTGGQGPALGEAGYNGQDSSFGTLTAKGGGGGGVFYGGRSQPQPHWTGNPGGSGGGGAVVDGSGAGASAGSATQPQQPGDSGSYGFGNAGAAGNSQTDPGSWSGGGGGGAGSAGVRNVTTGPSGNAVTGQSTYGAGGVGKQYDISGSQTYYAGGGGGGGSGNSGSTHPSGGLGGGGAGGIFPSGTQYLSQTAHPTYQSLNPGNMPRTSNSATDGIANRGGGGGGSADDSPFGISYGGAGGSGIVIVKY
jgi:hypothetical protein